MSKYKNEPTKVDGITFASKAEAERYKELRRLELMGIIKGLELQKSYKLVKGRWPSTGRPFSASYVADFVYQLDGETIVEDVKGFKTEAYELKKKLMIAVYGIEITEVRKRR